MKNNKVLVGIIVVMTIGIAFLVYERVQLKRQIVEFSSPAEFTLPHLRFDKKYSILPNFYSQSNQWDPFKEMDRLQKEMNRMFKDSFWRGAGLSNFERGHVFDLDADIKEKKDAYIIKLDIPGMDKSDINIELQDHNLIISGEKSGDVEENKENEFYKRERSFGYFSRAIPLPQNASDKNIQVDYKKGVLTIKIPKESDRKESIAKKQIFVK